MADPGRPSRLASVAEALARFSARFVPDAFSIACLLTVLAVVLGLTVGGAGPVEVVTAWGSSFWELLAFSMQIVVVIFAGYLVAVAPPSSWLLDRIARVPRSPRQAAAATALASMAMCWVNWGVGLIAGAMLVRNMARRHPDADYRLLVAMAYVGMGTTWHAGLSGSVPLLLATPGNFMVTGGLIDRAVPLGETVFTPFNLALMAVVAVVFSLLAAALHPTPERTVRASGAALDGLAAFEPPPRPDAPTPVERLMHAPLLGIVVGGMGLVYVAILAATGTLRLTLDSVNLAFLCLGIALHASPASILKASEEGSRALHGVVLQFPLYAGIYGIMKGTALAPTLASAFISVATTASYPLVVFVYSAVLNYFVPSGGGKWAIEAAYVLKAGDALGVPATTVAMAYAYGDMATNLIQPFWAIPLLSIAKLEFREVLGFSAIAFAVFVVLAAGALLLV